MSDILKYFKILLTVDSFLDPTFAKFEALIYDINPTLLIPTDLNADGNDTYRIVSKIQDMYIGNNTMFYANVSAYAEVNYLIFFLLYFYESYQHQNP